MSKHHDWNHDPCRISVIKLKVSVTEKQKTKGVCVEKIQLASKLYHFIICGLESWVKLWIGEKLVVLRFVQKVREKSASTQPKLHQIPETLRKMCFCIFTSVGQRKKFWVPMRNRTLDLRIPRTDALPLSHRDSTVSEVNYEVHPLTYFGRYFGRYITLEDIPIDKNK